MSRYIRGREDLAEYLPAVLLRHAAAVHQVHGANEAKGWIREAYDLVMSRSPGEIPEEAHLVEQRFQVLREMLSDALLNDEHDAAGRYARDLEEHLTEEGEAGVSVRDRREKMIDLAMLSRAALAQGNDERAICFLSDAVAIARELFDASDDGLGRLDLGQTLISLARAKKDVHDAGAALPDAEEGVEILRAAAEKWATPRTLQVLAGGVELLSACCQDTARSEVLIGEALELRRRLLRLDRTEAALSGLRSALAKRAGIRLKQDRPREARADLDEIVQMLDLDSEVAAATGSRGEDFLSALFRLSLCARNLGEAEARVAAVDRAIDVARLRLEHVDDAVALHFLPMALLERALCFFDEGKAEEGVPFAGEALALFEKALTRWPRPSFAQNAARAATVLIDLRAEAGMTHEADALIQRVRAVTEPYAAHPKVVPMLEALSDRVVD